MLFTILGSFSSHQHLIPVTHSVHARIQRGKGAECPDPPEKSQKYSVPFLEILVRIRWKITKLSSQHSMLGHHRLPSELKWHFTGWPKTALLVLFGISLLPSSTKKNNKKERSQSYITSDKIFWIYACCTKF